MKFDLMTVIGIVVGIALITLAIYMGGNMALFWNLPSILITVCGSFTALLINYDFNQIKKVFRIVKQVFTTPGQDPRELIEIFAELARKARREGLLALEDDINRIDDPFFAKGIQLMVDALEAEMIRDILETDIAYTVQRHRLGQEVFRTWANLAPGFGLIGTLIGLIQMLAKLDDPSALGPSMAVALLTTFYGALMANLLLTPIAGKLALRSEEEVLNKRLILEGIIAIQSGVNPRILEEKLNAFIPVQGRREETAQEESVIFNA
ncbi:motility protein A [Calderihabitans maritimus]|uniref:MotA/TolQ/ExbB proton channel n=1 Tax=Calderihabitans maritimus TaxID=1246530 RepID=A0A1Z5HUB9_9FIRM|nr:MotA/TolQ/ExbB proton channel family protein [Calderihabitans maritimus]GAW92925.1 MotA/TolQ/ExbB proton channel [Calderihabitans maritimus]